MLSKGNGEPAQCVGNLLRLIRGEVPYERLKGLDPRLIDKPAGTAAFDLKADAEWLIENYEPRVKLSNIDLDAELAKVGHFAIKAETE